MEDEVEIWRLETVDEKCLLIADKVGGDSRVSGGEGSFPDCDVVMLVVDVSDKSTMLAGLEFLRNKTPKTHVKRRC